MPWRRKPETWLEYWSGGNPTASMAAGFSTCLVYCVGPARGQAKPRCHHNATLPLASLPDWDWYDICAHLRCTSCDAVGYVTMRPNWPEVINFRSGVGQ